MTYVDELEAALVRGYYHRSRRRVPVALAAVVVVAAAAMALVVLAPFGKAPVERAVEPAPAAEPTADLPTVEEFRAATAEEVTALGLRTAPSGDVVAIPAPAGKEDAWFAFIDQGQVCLSVAEKLTCAPPEQYAAGRLFDVSDRSVYGLVPRDVVRATVVSPLGYEEEHGVDIVNQVWLLPKPIDSPVALVRADGTRFAPDSGRAVPVPPNPLMTTSQAIEHYAVLQDADSVVTPPPDLGPLVQEQLATPGATTYLVHEDERFREYVVVTNAEICSVTVPAAGGGGGGCGVDLQEFAEVGAGPSTLGRAGHRELVSLLLPDGSRDLQLHFKDGTTEALAIQANFAFAFIEKGIDSVTWIAPDGRPVSRG